MSRKISPSRLDAISTFGIRELSTSRNRMQRKQGPFDLAVMVVASGAIVESGELREYADPDLETRRIGSSSCVLGPDPSRGVMSNPCGGPQRAEIPT